MILVSALVGVAGLLGSGALATRLGRREGRRPGAGAWVLGLLGLLPGWLVAFWGLLGPTAGRPRPGSEAAWILSSAAGLLGVILTDSAASRLREASEAPRGVTQWLLGVTALAPAWLIALIGLAWGHR